MRMYNIQGYEDDFYTGRTSDARQVILGLLCPHLAAYYFSAEGALLHRELRPWKYPAPGNEGRGYNIYDTRFERHLSEQIQACKRELGFVSCPIHVHAFMDEEHYVGFEEATDSIGDDEIVFYWAKEYFLSPDGEVDST